MTTVRATTDDTVEHGTVDHGTVDHDTVVAELERARARTLAIIGGFDDTALRRSPSPLMSPMVWDLAHIGNYEELWLLRMIDGRDPIDPALDDLYNAFEHPRWERPSLPILGPSEARRYDADVRAAVLDLLRRTDLSDTAPSRLTRHAFVHAMVIQHEHQHDETLLATVQLMGDEAVAPPGSSPSVDAPGPQPVDAPVAPIAPMRRIDGGTFTMGTDHPWAYDNERDPHEITLPPYRIDTFPVSNRDFAAFVGEGGYEREDLWSGQGWAWRNEASLQSPGFWQSEGGDDWSVLRFGSRVDLVAIADQPVQHVGWYEADAFARWAGKRLPTEAEWERAAEGTATIPGHPARANLGARYDGPRRNGSYPEGVSTHGVHQLIGDVWEWTSSPFRPHPGFEAYPYAEYSEVFWGTEYRVLKGGSWAADHTAVRPSFRNWDLPIRRQIFSGFRCAADD